MNKNDRIINAIQTALVADAYALGAHWVYDGKELAGLNIDWQDLNQAQSPWHKGKACGQFTHYGDHGSWLYEFIIEQQLFEIADYRDFWKAKMSQYEGYIDSSSKDTLAIIHQNSAMTEGAKSSDLSIIGRISPLLLVSSSEDEYLSLVNTFVSFTHNDVRVKQAASYFGKILYRVIHGQNINEALLDTPIDVAIEDTVKKAMESKSQDSFRAIRDFGPACGINGGLEGTIHLLSKYDNIEEALIENAKAGGDSAARGMVVAMIMGASGVQAPTRWRKETTYFAQLI